MAKMKRLPKHIRSVDDLLADDEVKQVLDSALKDRARMASITIIYESVEEEGRLTWDTTLSTPLFVAQLERVKFDLLAESAGLVQWDKEDR